MLSLRRAKPKPGWVGIAPHGDRVHVAHVVCTEGQRPTLSWHCSAVWDDPARALRALRQTRPVARQRTVGLLQHGQYQLLAVEAPDVPREEWPDAVRWRLKEMVDFAVEDAAIAVIELPVDPQQRRRPGLIAVAAARAALAPLANAGTDAGLPWHALDVAETALRNIAVLGAEAGRGEALLHVGAAHSTLVVVAEGELLLARHIEISLAQLSDADESVRQPSYERASLELQRTLDNVERQFSHANLARLQIAPGAALQGFIDYVRDLVYVPVTAFDPAALFDLSALQAAAAGPDALDPAALAACLPAIGAALR